MTRGLAQIAGWQIATAAVLVGVVLAFRPDPTSDSGNMRLISMSSVAGLVVVLVSMLIGFLPLRMLLRRGPDNIVAGWIAAMMLRMAATLTGLVLLIKQYQFHTATCVWTVCGGYLLLLAVETIGMVGLMRSEFEKRQARRDGEPGE